MRASRLALRPSNTGARGQPHTCFTAWAVTTALLQGTRRTIPWVTRLSGLPLGGRRGRSVSGTTRRAEKRQDGELFQSGIRPGSRLLSLLRGPPAGGLHCFVASMIGSRRPPTLASAAPTLPGNGSLGGGPGAGFWAFPAFEPAAKVLVESSGSPSGYGSRSLLARELEDLWDVPILLLDSLSDAEVTGLMEGICQSPPSKLLHTGADLLLRASFRGGVC